MSSQATLQEEPARFLRTTGEQENATYASSSVAHTWGQIIADGLSQSLMAL